MNAKKPDPAERQVPKRKPNLKRALASLAEVKARLVAKSNAAEETVRSCEGCDAHCCKVGFNSMLLHRIEAEALRRRLHEADLAPLIPLIREKAMEQMAEHDLLIDKRASYTCPLLSDDGRCLVHGPAQPMGCLTFRPVSDGGCDHDHEFFEENLPAVLAADRDGYGRESEPLSIPVALERVLRPGKPGRARRGGRAGGRPGARSRRRGGSGRG